MTDQNPTYICPDCEKETDIKTQTYPAKYNRPDVHLATCWTTGCDLRSVTLTIEEHEALTEAQRESYRDMNRKYAAAAV